MKKVTKDMTIAQAMSINPRTGEVLIQNGIHCIGCGGISFERIEDGLSAHGLSKKEIENILNEINTEKNITITDYAKEEIEKIMLAKYKYLRIKEDGKRLGLSLETSKKTNDIEIIENKIKIIFDKKLENKIKDITINYEKSKGGFLIK